MSKYYKINGVIENDYEKETALKNTLPKTRDGKPFSLERPRSIPGAIINDPRTIDISFLRNRRAGVGNYNLERQGIFLAPEVADRLKYTDFEKKRLLDIQLFGQKVQLSEKTLGSMYNIKVPDNTDADWLAEKARLEGVYRARGMTPEQIQEMIKNVPPFGRAQRTVTKNVNNIAYESGLSADQKLEELKQEVATASVLNIAEQQRIVAQLAILLQPNQFQQLTQASLVNITNILNRMTNIPTDYRGFGLARILDVDYYTQNAGLINLFLLSNVRIDPDYNGGAGPITLQTPLRNFASRGADPQGYPPLSINSIITTLRKGRYIDLEDRSVINQPQLINRVLQMNPPNFTNPLIAIAVPPPMP